jgi:hypothetical protein
MPTCWPRARRLTSCRPSLGDDLAARAEAEEWARPDLGDQVVEFNILCECSVIS